MTRRRLERVDWLDSWSERGGWHDIADLRRDADTLPTQTTVGFVIAETKRTLVVASTLSESRELASAVVAIPKSAVQRRARVRVR